MGNETSPWHTNFYACEGIREGIGNVTFTRTDGKTFTVENVLFETISTVGANAGVVCVELADGNRIVNVPFVQSWEISY
jgi:hypothetical protein